MIEDRYGRVHDYLRISLTDSCNFRCTYCMPEGPLSFMPARHLMQPCEIEAIATTFVRLGVKKVRLTGGEPLVRKDAPQIIERLAKLPVNLTLTTNGLLVDRYVRLFRDAGIHSLNVSLDTLEQEKFSKIARRDGLHKVWDNILLLLEEGFHVKLNVVAMKGINDNEIPAFIRLTKELPLHVRFIEFMPFKGNKWEQQKVITAEQMLSAVGKDFSFIKLKDEKHATARKFKVPGYTGTFAFITTMSAPFCADCNRMRLTADGKMKNCLFSKNEEDILGAYRSGEDIIPVIRNCIGRKHAQMGGQFGPSFQQTDGERIENRSMVKIGG